jgi:hypothetical protein
MSDEAYEEAKEAIEKTWTDAQDEYNDFKDAVDDYSADVDLFKTSKETLEGIKDSLSAAELEKITYSMQFHLDLDQKELDWIEYKLNKISDNFYKRAEAAALMVGNIETGSAGG